MSSISTVLFEETVMGILLGVVLIVFVVFTFILRYHWRNSGIATPILRKMQYAYNMLSTSLALISVVLYIAVVITL